MVIAKDPSYLSLQYFHLTLWSNNIGTHNEIIIDNEFLSASIILLYMYQPKNVYLILIVSLIECVVNRTIHNICMYVYNRKTFTSK